MKINSKNKISKIVYLIDKHIVNLLFKQELNEEQINTIDTLTNVRFEYIKELNNLIRVKNTRNMYDKEYHKIYKKRKW